MMTQLLDTFVFLIVTVIIPRAFSQIWDFLVICHNESTFEDRPSP